MNDEQLAWVLGIGGSLIGLIGAWVGVQTSLKHARSPDERRLMVRATFVVGVLIAAFLSGLFLLPTPYNWFLWPVYLVALVALIVGYNRRAARLRPDSPTAQPAGQQDQ